MSLRRLLAIAVLAVVPAVVLLVQAGPAAAFPPPFHGASMVEVATSGTDSPSCGSVPQPCATITYALGIVSPGGTIRVGPGVYAEQLTIAQPVTIIGAGTSLTSIEPTSLATSDTDTDSSTPQFAIVDVAPGTDGVFLQSLTINGSAATGSFTSCADDFVGIYFHNATGSLTGVDVTGVELSPSLFGCQDGLGVYVATGSTSPTDANVAMSNVAVTAYDKNGITCDDLGTVCSIFDSTVTGVGPTALIAENGIQDWGASSLSVFGSTVTGNSYTDPNFDPNGASDSPPFDIWAATGVLVVDAGALSLTDNTIESNDDNVYAMSDFTGSTPPAGDPTPGRWVVAQNDVSNALISNPAVGPGYTIGDGIDLDSTSNDVSVIGNTASNDPEFGVAVFGSSNASAQGNAASDDGIGVFVGGPGPTLGLLSTDDVLSANTSVNNSLFGIYADPLSSAVHFIDNQASGNGADDVADLSTGSGTEGTANTWIDTSCSTSSPSGLCVAHHIGIHPGPFPFPHRGFGLGHGSGGFRFTRFH